MTLNTVNIFPNPNPEARLKAFATVLVNNAIVLRGIRIFSNQEKPDELYVLYPRRQRQDGSWRAVYSVGDAEARKKVDDCILDAYRQVIKEPGSINVVEFNDPGEKPEDADVTWSSTFVHGQAVKVNCTLDSQLTLRSIYLVKGTDGVVHLRVPRYPLKDGKWGQYYHPVSAEARAMLVEKLTPLYEKALKEQPAAAEAEG